MDFHQKPITEATVLAALLRLAWEIKRDELILKVALSRRAWTMFFAKVSQEIVNNRRNYHIR